MQRRRLAMQSRKAIVEEKIQLCYLQKCKGCVLMIIYNKSKLNTDRRSFYEMYICHKEEICTLKLNVVNSKIEGIDRYRFRGIFFSS